MSFQLRKLSKSIAHASHGLRQVFRSEQNFQIQVFAAIFVVGLAAYFHVRVLEWILLLLMIGSVLVLELVNSILERIVDTFKPRIHPMVKEIKDITAAVVLLASFIACLIGILIFYPYILNLFEGIW